MLIGHIKEIVRHPVKSLRGEEVQQSKIMNYGLYGDRSHAYLVDTKEGNFLTITQFREMVRYQARFVGEESLDKYPNVEVITPEGEVFDWEDQRNGNKITTKNIYQEIYLPRNIPLYMYPLDPLR
ncbi:MOSC N-terminal beta barrel domain-containing protein [Gracilibacillus caseinilyticus]|uniref:MOSC N-terminal beta barrel domain-containing protein n=1 Tax=Gracilibacillus caseinilyticus TaxID=2932256 RepID=UPI00350FEF6D